MNRILLYILLFPSISFTQNSLNTELLYHWMDSTIIGTTLYDNAYNEVWGMVYNNKEFAVIGSTNGTHIFDVTDPINTIEVAYVAGSDQGAAIVHRDYHDLNGYLYIVCDEGASTLQIVDVSNLPNSFNVVYDSNSLFKRAHNIFIDTSSEHLYVCSETQVGFGNNFNALHIYDLSNPVNPTHHYTYNDVGHVHDAFVKNDTAFLNCGNQGLRIVDFSMVGPMLQVVHQELGSLTSYPDAGYNHSGWPTSDGNYYVMADENHGNQMKLLDVSSFANPTVLSLFFSDVNVTESMPHNQIIDGHYVYTAHYHDGFYVHDISDPLNPLLIGFYDTFDPNHHNSYMGAWGVYPFLPSGNILVSDMQTGLYVFQVNYSGVPSGLDENINPVNIFPNPASDKIYLDYTLPGMLKIYDLSGHLVKEHEVIPHESVNINNLPHGFYLLQLEFDDFIFQDKLLKQ